VSVAKIIEINAESEKSFEDAIDKGIKHAATTVRGIKGAWVKGQQVVVNNDQITMYRVDLKVTFVLN
jgi:dodecin